MALGTGDLGTPRALTRARLEPGAQSPSVPRLRIPARGRDLAALSPLAASSILYPTRQCRGRRGPSGRLQAGETAPVSNAGEYSRATHHTSLAGREPDFAPAVGESEVHTHISPYRSLGKRVLSGGSQVGHLFPWFSSSKERYQLLDQAGLSLPGWVPNQSQVRGRRNLKGPQKDPRITLLCPRRRQRPLDFQDRFQWQ